MALRYCKSIVKLLLLFCLNAGLLPDAVYGQDQMYWTSRFGRSIHRANLDGTGVENLITAVPVDPFGIDLDVASGKMYWTDRSSGTIQRANLDATGVETLVSGLIYVDGIALDVNGDKMYWTQFRPNMIRRANLDGSDVENLVHISNLASVPLGIALDVDGGKMYWIDAEAFAIWRANLDGTDVEAIVTVRGGADITLDVDGGKMYWTAPPFIVRANLDGSDLEILVRDLELPLNIALDVANDKMYWTDGRSGKIQRANLDGTGVEDLVTGLDRPEGIALTVENALPSAVEEPIELPRAYHLSAPYPNPFNAQTTFTLAVEQPQHVYVAVYDARGRRLATLHDGRVQAHQRYTFSIAGDEWASGLYFYEVVGEHFQASRSVALLK